MKKNKKKEERKDMIQNVIYDTENYIETRNIYQEIIDDIFEDEIKKITDDPEIVEMVELQKSMYT